MVQARPGPDFKEMGTSGSGSVIDAWFNHRIAAAALRTMLVGAAAAKWNVAAAECHTENGEVRHGGSNRRARFGTLVEAARQLAVPEKPEPPAVLNAVFAATGIRIRSLPIQAQSLQKA